MRIIELNLDDLDEDLAELLLVSGKVKTGEQLMRKALLDWIDPLIATGPEFEFEGRMPPSGATVKTKDPWKLRSK